MTERFIVHHGDNMAILPTLADCSVDAIVTDPPAGIAFMNKSWDSDKGGRDAWIAWLTQVMSECLRVLKPGGHALVWALPRTSHWTGMAIENAGFVIRERIAHAFSQGFPKSLSVSKAIDRAAGAQRGADPVLLRQRGTSGEFQVGMRCGICGLTRNGTSCKCPLPEASTDAARQWQGWGTALKPAIEDWWLARKPLRGNVAANVLEWGTGALNIDKCRIDGEAWKAHRATGLGSVKFFTEGNAPVIDKEPHALGRWPANLILSGEPEVLAAFPQAPGQQRAVGPQHGDKASVNVFGDYGPREQFEPRGDTGSAARFFMQCPPDEATSLYYTPKASRSDRDKGNTHSTVKPISLMRYLCRLITPPDGVVLDPFTGSGSSGQAAMFEGFRFIGIEQDAGHVELARHRIGLAARNGSQQPLGL